MTAFVATPMPILNPCSSIKFSFCLCVENILLQSSLQGLFNNMYLAYYLFFFILQNKIFEIIFWMTLNSVITCYLSFFCNSEECDLFFLTSLSFFKLEKI